MSPAAADLRPRRLVLTAAELELLRRLAGDLPLPPGFQTALDTGAVRYGTAPGEAASLAAAAATLASRGAVRPDPGTDPLACQLHPAVAFNLAVLARPEVLVLTRASSGKVRVRAAHAVAGTAGASLARLDDRLVELSLFAATDLGRELIRAVPEPPAGPPGPRPAGLVPLDALERLGATLPGRPDLASQLATDLGLDPAQTEAVRALGLHATGVLHCLVTGAPAHPQAPRRVGQVVWLATPSGWVGAQPEPSSQNNRLVRLVPVRREDLGTWIAPLVGGVLER